MPLVERYAPPKNAPEPRLFLKKPPSEPYSAVGRVEVFHSNVTEPREILQVARTAAQEWGCAWLIDWELVRAPPNDGPVLRFVPSALVGDPNNDPDTNRRVFLCAFPTSPDSGALSP